MPRN
jgi:hypothetical protein